MADDIDQANDRTQKYEELRIASIRKAAASIPVGFEGECELCGEISKRLVNEVCARCRDKYKLG